ncbi:MAG: DUF5130 family protein [Sciscionella sp.]
MAAGEIVEERDEADGMASIEDTGGHELEYGHGEMAGGRISVAREVKPEPPAVPFTPAQLSKLDEALTLSSRESGVDFTIYLGGLGEGDEDTRAEAERLHASQGSAAAAHSVLIAVSPGQRKVEIVTGEDSSRRLADRSCKLAVMSMVASFKEGDLLGGLLGGLRMLSDQAGSVPRT